MSHHQSAANAHMHRANFSELLARFEDPARAKWQRPNAVLAHLGSLTGKTVVDLGAGSGYFAFRLAKKASRVIAINIDERFQEHIEKCQREDKKLAGVEARLTTPDTPGLTKAEADIVLLVNTYHHIDRRVAYLKKLRRGLRQGGSLFIVDFKDKETPPGPPIELRLPASQVEAELKSAGFGKIAIEIKALPYQYIVSGS